MRMTSRSPLRHGETTASVLISAGTPRQSASSTHPPPYSTPRLMRLFGLVWYRLVERAVRCVCGTHGLAFVSNGGYRVVLSNGRLVNRASSKNCGGPAMASLN